VKEARSEEPQEGTSHAGTMQWLFDTRDNTFYLLPSGERRDVRVKYMDTQFDMMAQPDHALVQCRYYDASEFANYRTIYYKKPYLELLFLRAPKLSFDSNGKVEDFDAHGESFVEVE
jgi:hypothetical protein